MNVRYEVMGVSFDFVCDEAEDLKALLDEIMGHVRSSHSELGDDDGLLVRVTDGVLNSLVDDRQEIELGELVTLPERQVSGEEDWWDEDPAD